MGIRETLNENRSVTVGATIGIIVLAIIWIIWYSFSGNGVAGDGRQFSSPTTVGKRDLPTTQE